MSKTPSRIQTLDAGPRGAANLEAMSALSTGKKGQLSFFKGDDNHIGSHTVYDFHGEQQDVGMVQTWNQCEQMLLTTANKAQNVIVMDTETGATMSELSLRRQQKNWNLSVDSITPMMKFEQYRPTAELGLFGLGDGGKTVFALNHDARAGENVEEFVIKADSSRKYKSYTFTCHAQTRAGNLVLGRTDGGVALYDAIMQSENASMVLDGMPGPVTSIDVSADGSMLVWTTPEFVFFSRLSDEHWMKGKKGRKPAVLQLAVEPAIMEKITGGGKENGGNTSAAGGEGEEGEEDDAGYAPANWMSVRFDAGTAKDDVGLAEREILTYSGQWQLRWKVVKALKAWEELDDDVEGEKMHDPFYGVATNVGGTVMRHVTVKDDVDVVALGDELVKSLRF